jgi:uncharacterized protein YjdB
MAQTNVALTAVASQTGGGVTVYGPANYNDGVITTYTACGSACPTPWGWVDEDSAIIYTWPTAVSFNKIVFYKADRPITTCNVQYWNGTAFVPLLAYSSTNCPADSFTFGYVTTTILKFTDCVAPFINPNFREIQVWQDGPTITGDSSLCAGGTISLTASSSLPSPVYMWTGPASFSATGPTISVPATLAAAGDYSCTVTSGGVTSPPTVDSIHVIPLPTITLGPNPSVCVGATTIPLTYTATTGSPSTYSITYSTAAIAAGFINDTAVTLPVSPIHIPLPAGITGTYSGTLTVSNGPCPGPSSYPFTVTINPLPPPITYDSAICQGVPVTFTDAAPGGTWSSSNPAIAAADPALGDITGLTAGVFVTSYTLPTGCFVTTPPITVNVPPAPITGPAALCMGSAATYGETATGGIWTSSAPAVATIDSFSGLATPVAPGTTVLDYSNGCGSGVTDTITINPLPDSIAGVFDACAAHVTYLTDATPGGVWSSINPSIATVSGSGIVTGVTYGIATIDYTLPTSCFVTETVSITHTPVAITGHNSVCTAATDTLAETVTGGIWTSSNASLAAVGSSTGIVSGVSLGVVNITYSIGSGCSIMKTVTVNPIQPIVGRDSVCVGSTGYLTDIVGGGVWVSQYPAVATISSDSGLVYGITAGMTRITYTLPTGCVAYANVRVIASPPAITAAIASVCPGNTISLSDPLSGGTWSSADNFTATINASTGVVTGVFPDTVTIFYRIAPGCVTATQVLVNPDPAAITGADSIICPGVTDTLHDATPGGVWSSTTPTFATVSSSGVVSTLAGGVATIKYTLPLTGCSTTTNISEYPAPTPAVTYVQADGTLYADTGYVSYQWYDSISGKITGATSPTLALLYTEYYYVVVTDSNGCTAASLYYEFDSSVLDVNQNSLISRTSIYPNPTDGFVYISSPVNVRAVISGIDGKMEIEQKNAKGIDLGKLASGVYLMALYDDNGHILMIQKVTKE